MNIVLKDRSKISGNNLSTLQMIMFHWLSSKSTNDFSKRLTKHFGTNLQSKDDHLIKFITIIDNFSNGTLFVLSTKRTNGDLIKPFNYILKPFLLETGQGAKNLITAINEDDKVFLSRLKNSLELVLTKVY